MHSTSAPHQSVTTAPQTTTLSNIIDTAILRGIARLRVNTDLTQARREQLLQLCRHTLQTPALFTSDNTALTSPIENHATPPQPFILFVSLYQQHRLLACHAIAAPTFAAAAIASTQRGLQDFSTPPNPATIRIEISLLIDPQPFPANLAMIEHSLRLGIDAISLRHADKFAVFKSSVAIQHGFDTAMLLQKLSNKCGISLNAADISTRKTIISRWRSIDFRESFDTRRSLCDLYRGNLLCLQHEVDDAAIQRAANASYQMLSRFIQQSDAPAYLYQQHWQPPTEPAHHLRILASLWVAAQYNDPVILPCIDTHVQRFIARHFHQSACIVNGITDIGINGCLLLLLTTRNTPPFHPYCHALHNYLLRAHDAARGKFSTITTPALSNAFHESELFLPGIALNALLHYDRAFSTSHAPAIAANILPYYQNLLDTRADAILMASWMVPAYTELFFITRLSAYRDFVFALLDPLLNQQVTHNDPDIDLIGSFSRAGSAAVTATLTDCLLDGHRLAAACHDTARQSAYHDAIYMAARFILQSQYTADNCHDPHCYGGFKNSFIDAAIRIDNQQHVTHTLTRLHNYSDGYSGK